MVTIPLETPLPPENFIAAGWETYRPEALSA